VLNRGHIPIYSRDWRNWWRASGGRAAALHDDLPARSRRPAGCSGRGNSLGRRRLVGSLVPSTVVEQIAPHIGHDCIVVFKSTVPGRHQAKLAARLKELTGRDVDVASNPEFLKEAWPSTLHEARPRRGRRATTRGDRGDAICISRTSDRQAAAAMSPESAEMTKYVAMPCSRRVSFITKWRTCANRRGRHQRRSPRHRHDSRIGLRVPFPGVGYGRKLLSETTFAPWRRLPERTASNPGCSDAVHAVNERQKTVLAEKIERALCPGRLSDKAIAVWGLAFKPGTDDIREAPSLVLIERLLARRTTIRVYDPEAMENVPRRCTAIVIYCQKRTTRSSGPTPWPSAPSGNNSCIGLRGDARVMRQPVIFDGRNIYNPQRMRAARLHLPTASGGRP